MYKFIYLFFYDFPWKRKSKISLTHSIRRSEQFHHKSSDSKVQLFQFTLW